jgi:hypothetical protein
MHVLFIYAQMRPVLNPRFDEDMSSDDSLDPLYKADSSSESSGGSSAVVKKTVKGGIRVN